MKEQEGNKFLGCLIALLLSLAIYAVGAYMLQVFWNWIGLPLITYWQALLICLITGLIGIVILSRPAKGE